MLHPIVDDIEAARYCLWYKAFRLPVEGYHHYPGNLDDVQVAMAFDVLCLAS